MRRTRLAVAICACVFSSGASLARGGEYHVYSCRTPAGGVAPTDGWVGSAAGAFVVAEDKCAKGGALVAALGDGYEHEASDAAIWRFIRPFGETLTSAALWRAGDADGGTSKTGTYEFWLAAPDQAEIFDECVYGGSTPCTVGEGEPEEPLAPSNRITVPNKDLGENIYVGAACFTTPGRCKKGEHDPDGYAAVVYLYAADLTLEQSAQPVVGGVGGELATAPTLSGTDDLSVEAFDPDSGVYQAVFSVDGREVGRTLLSENGGHCRDVGETTDGLPAFLYLQPCVAGLSADVPFDTTAVSDGSHHLVVSVTDAAGNATVALDRTVDFANHPVGGTALGSAPASVLSGVSTSASMPNGEGATAAARLSARWTATPRPSLTARFGAAETVAGRLLAPDGSPIADAAVAASFLPEALGAPARGLRSVRTGGDGAFRLRLPAGTPSGRLTLAYSSRTGQPAPDVTASLRLEVPASLSLRVAPRVSRAGGTIRFAGVLRGSPLPAGGKQLVLEARVPGGAWRQFRVIATHAHGRYTASYRFRLPGPVVYQFRALCPHEADFPYAKGGSNVVAVRER